jgi:hypothetical protein
MDYSPLNTDQLADNATDDFPFIAKRYKQYVLANQTLLSQGTTKQMLNSGYMWGYARWIYIMALIPLSFTVIYIVFQNSALGLTFSDSFSTFKQNNPGLVKPIAAITALLVVGGIVYMVCKPLSKLGLWGSNINNQPQSYDDVESNLEFAFFTQPLRTESGYNAIFVYVILIFVGLIGLVLTVANLSLGLSILAGFFLAALLWFTYQKKSRPVLQVSRKGIIKLYYSGGIVKEFNITDCEKIEMIYADNAYYNTWYLRPFVRAMYKAMGASALFPYKVVFYCNNNATVSVSLENLYTNNKSYINTWESEFYIAGLLKEHGFTIACNIITEGMLTPAINGWVAANA